MDDEEYSLSQLLLGATSPSPFLTSPTSPTSSPAPLPQVQQRPISKRRGKKRSSRACGACRARKVRCNIVAHGAPCSNCKHDEVDCCLPLSRRQKSARERAERERREQSQRGSINGMDVEDHCSGSEEFESISRAEDHKPSNTRNSTHKRAQSVISTTPQAPHATAISEPILSESIPPSRMNQPQHTTNPTPHIFSPTKSWIQVQIEAPLSSAPIPQDPGSKLTTLPQIFAPLPRHLDIHDLTYLNFRGALALPSEPLQVALLKAYIEFVHPNFPLLDLEEFLSVVKHGLTGEDENWEGIEQESDGNHQISFLLFQAVMFAGVEYVPLKALNEAGYKTRESAQRAFLNRVRLLYDFDTTTSRLPIIQSLLLMSLIPSPNPTSPDGKDGWHWLGLAISLSYSLGLNRTDPQENTNVRRKRLHRRVWWTAFIRDRTLALDAGSLAMPMRIRREDCEVEMLSLDDFELGMDNRDEEEGLRKSRDAMAFVEKARLCWCFHEVLVPTLAQPCMQPEPPLQQDTLAHSFPSDVGQYQRPLQAGSSMDLDLEKPLFESREDIRYQIATSSSPSANEDCVTPRDGEEEQHAYRNVERKLVCSSPLGAGYGVDGEYDDYLEYLKGPAIGKGKESDRSSWAFQLDCVNDCVVEV